MQISKWTYILSIKIMHFDPKIWIVDTWSDAFIVQII
jgi:hypothetical protein